MTQNEKDLSFIKEIIADLITNGFVVGGKTDSMLNDWHTDLCHAVEEETCKRSLEMSYYYYVFYSYHFGETNGFKEFESADEALNFIQDQINNDGAEMKDFRMVNGNELILKAKEVVTKIVIDRNQTAINNTTISIR